MYISTHNDPGRGTGDDRDTGHGWRGSYNNIIIVTNKGQPVTIEILDTAGEVAIIIL